MQQVWFTAALWLFLALVAVLAANWLRVSTALSEIVVGTLAQLAIGALAGAGALNAKTEWIAFLAGTGAIVLTFLAGAELDPAVFRAKWKESVAVGLAGFFFPFFRTMYTFLLFLKNITWSWFFDVITPVNVKYSTSIRSILDLSIKPLIPLNFSRGLEKFSTPLE